MKKFFNVLMGFGIAIILLFTIYAIAEQNDYSTLGWDRTYGNSIFRVDSSKDFIPGKDDTYSIGNATKEIKNIYVDGTANIDSLSADTADINGGSIDGATIGASSASTGEFTTLKATTHILYLSEIVTSDTDITVTVANSGAVYTNDGAGATAKFTLPTAAAGLTYTFTDVEVAAGKDLTIQAAADDTINGGTAAKAYECTTDSAKHSVTLVAIDAVQWIVVSECGTWANNNS